MPYTDRSTARKQIQKLMSVATTLADLTQSAELTTEIEAARLITYRSAWLYDTEGPTPNTTNELFRAKLVVGRAVSQVTRIGLTLGGAHGIFKGTRMEQLFRDGALAELHAPPTDFCLWSIGQHELNLNPDEVLPPMRRV